MTQQDIAAWEGFALALAGASAVLAGLVFVAVSINIDRILRTQGLPGRAGESVILLIATVCECAFVLVPHQPVTALAVELIVAGVLTCMVALAILVPALRRPSRQPRSWHATRAISIVACTIPIVLAGFSLLGWLPGGLYWLVGGVLLSIAYATTNAWVLLVEVVRDERYRPSDIEIPSSNVERMS
jgi:modulator of FtsH protease